MLQNLLRIGFFVSVVILPISGRAAEPAKASPKPRENPTHNRLMALSEAEKQAAFAHWAKGEGCGHVTRTFFQGQAPDGTAIWNIACSRGPALSV